MYCCKNSILISRVGIKPGFYHKAQPGRVYGFYEGGFFSVSARPEFRGVIDDPLFENLGVIGKFRGSELF